jgi:hypothetical protein
MRKLILICLILACGIKAAAQPGIGLQTERLMNNVSVNLLGDGSNVALYYERWIRITDFFFVTAKLGGGYGKKLTLENTVDTILPSPPLYYTIPANFTFNAGKGRHFVEAGMGSTITIGDVNPHFLYYFTGGYRLQPLKRGNMSLRVFGNYLFNKQKEFRNLYFVPFGISFGIAF